MKKIIVLGLLLASGFANASGKISVVPSYFTDEGKFGGKIGLSVYEKIMGPVSFNSWFGVGRDYDKGVSAHWAVSKAGLDFQLPKGFTVGAGAEVDYSFDIQKIQPSVYMGVSYKIW